MFGTKYPGFALAAVLALGISAGDAGAQDRPVVVELFTSQSCFSCPSAEEFLGKLAREPDLIALEFHVDYWNDLNYGSAGRWKDPFSRPEFTRRQQNYNQQSRNKPGVYTPQMVIDGRAHVAGHRRDEVESLIATAKARPGTDLALSITEDSGGGMSVSIPASDFRGEADVMMVLYDDAHETPIRRGENAGRTLTYSNVVRELGPIGTYRGEAIVLELPMRADRDAARDGCAILVQEAGLGPILGAAMIDLRQ